MRHRDDIPIHAVPAESSAGHKASRDCPCGPVAMRDLGTGQVRVWRHHRAIGEPYRPGPPPTRDDAVRQEPVGDSPAATDRAVPSLSAP